MDTDRIADLELLLGHHFRDTGYIENALSHSSIKSERRPSNERLEFLGDSVLGLVVAEALYRRFDDDEGTLTRIKSHAVSRATLQRIAQAMGLDRYILVGKGVAKREIPASLLGNLFEAIIGAIYLDAGLASARKFILRHLDVVIEEIVEDRSERNYKSMLQHYCQRDLGAVPTYRVVREFGPAHGRAFEVAIVVGGKEYGRAKAASKKEAEQGAARAALIHFRQVDESPRDVTTRGAGTLLRVGTTEPAVAKKKRRRKRSRRGAAEPVVAAEPAAAAAQAEPVTEAPVPESAEKPARRRRGNRGGRRRRGRAGGEAQEAVPAPAMEPQGQRPPSKAGETRKQEPAAAKAPRKRASRAKAKKKTAAKPAEKPAPAKKAGRSRRKKKTS